MLDITREHPEYVMRRVTFQQYRDLYAGGAQFALNSYAYLTPRQREPQQVYAERASHAYYENYIGSIIDWYAATLFRREPVITLDGDNVSGKRFFGQLNDDCDRKGTALTDFFRSLFTDTLVQGASHILVDFPRPGTTPLTRAEEEAQGISRAFLVPYTAEELINWSRDPDGNYEWVVLRTSQLRQERIDVGDWTPETRWLYLDRTQYRLWRQSSKPSSGNLIEIEDQGTHALAKLHRVPLFDLRATQGLWLMNKAASLQLEHFNKSNALSWALTNGLFATPVVYSDKELTQNIGDSYFLQLGAGDRFGWTEPQGNVHHIASQNLERLQTEIYRVSYLLAQAGGPSSAAQSGLSKLRDYAITIEILRGYGDMVKDCMKRVLRTIEQTREDGLAIDVSGLDEFDIADFSNDLDEAERLLKLGIESPTMKRQVFKKLALKYLCDARQELKDQIAAEIDESHRG
ncbi:MAG: hypothetical protein K2X03_20570 [Bryobacteraceae bacterium]|nr:hypothetical protein [Bryobacteraceae bacterium]